MTAPPMPSYLPEPRLKPSNPHFSSGPCAKRPGWSPETFDTSLLGRSHRSPEGKARLKLAIDKTRDFLQVPDDYLIGIVPASDTGAFEMAMWSLLGARGVDVLAWESFGKGWVTDIVRQLKLENTCILEADYGEIVDLASVNFQNDVVFTWNGTTSGVRVPDGAWIPDDRAGLTLCDATSAAFAQDLDWPKLDVTTYSWQKVLGGEAQHGMIILSPRAVERLESYTPPWPMPKIFRMTKDGKLLAGLFEGATINTPSMLCVEDYLDALNWAEQLGGLPALLNKADTNFKVVEDWVNKTDWVDFLAHNPETRSNTSVCLKFADTDLIQQPETVQAKFAKDMVAVLDARDVAKDIGFYRDAPPGLRIWCGATVEHTNLETLMPWLDWAFAFVRTR